MVSGETYLMRSGFSGIYEELRRDVDEQRLRLKTWHVNSSRYERSIAFGQ